MSEFTEKKWRTLKLDGSTFLYQLTTDESSYSLLLTDMQQIFKERLEGPAITDRCEELNPAVEAPVEEVVDQLVVILGSPQTKFVRRDSDDLFELDVTGLVFGSYEFLWKFRLSRENQEFFRQAFTTDLILSTDELLRERDHLIKTIKAKDLQIYDLEQSGASLSRKSLKTEVFDQKAFVTEKNFVSAENCDLAEVVQSDKFTQLINKVHKKPAQTVLSPPKPVKTFNVLQRALEKKNAKRAFMSKDDLFDEGTDEEDLPNETQTSTQVPSKKPKIADQRKLDIKKKLRKL